MDNVRQIRLKINGQFYEVAVESQETLVHVLREKLGLTGTKLACGNGECGNCTVLINEKPVLACLTLAIECEGKEILTIEGLARNGQLHPVQQAFIDNHAIACGHCTPAMVLCAYALLNSNHNPTEYEIKKAISGVLCRCTGYVKIVKAIRAAAQTIKKS